MSLAIQLPSPISLAAEICCQSTFRSILQQQPLKSSRSTHEMDSAIQPANLLPLVLLLLAFNAICCCCCIFDLKGLTGKCVSIGRQTDIQTGRQKREREKKKERKKESGASKGNYVYFLLLFILSINDCVPHIYYKEGSACAGIYSSRKAGPKN